ncbi:MAG: hypothetical protein M3Y35_11575 [Actinomycetota bacterium]|nr:hypothetical protein [Actinomycetota bacterium]
MLADPKGNEFCVFEPGNSFLADCGFLGELAGEGTRQVGLFWAEALGWYEMLTRRPRSSSRVWHQSGFGRPARGAEARGEPAAF